MTTRPTAGARRSVGTTMPDAVLEMPTAENLETLRGRLKHFRPKQVIYHENDRAECAYRVRRGLVKVLKSLPNGRVRTVRLHARGHWLGLEGVTGARFDHTAACIGDVEVEAVPVYRLRRLEDRDPASYIGLLRERCRHLEQADMWIAEFSTGEIKPRVARLLVFLARLEYGESSNLVDLLTVHDLSDILGVTSESVSKILADFKRRRILYRAGRAGQGPYRIDSPRLYANAQR